MSRGLLLLVLALAAVADAGPPASAPAAPTRAALQRVLESASPSLVLVEGPRARGPGVVVGNGGEILTTVDHVSLQDARVHVGKAARVGAVVHAQADSRLAVVQVEQPEALGLSPVPVRALEFLEPGSWVVALVREKKGWAARPHAVKKPVGMAAPHVTLAARLPLGTPLFDPRGRLVAMVVRLGPGAQVQALPLASLQRAVAGRGEASATDARWTR